MRRWSVSSMPESKKQWFIGQHTQKLARISQASRRGISVFSPPIIYSKTLCWWDKDQSARKEVASTAPWKTAADCCWTSFVHQFHQHQHTNGSDSWTNPHHPLLPYKILHPVGLILFSWIIELLMIHVSKILVLKTWYTLSQLCLNLATFSEVWAKAVLPGHSRGEPWMLETSTAEPLPLSLLHRGLQTEEVMGSRITITVQI